MPAGVTLSDAGEGSADAAVAMARFYSWVALRDRAALEHAAGKLLTLASRDASSADGAASADGQLHWSVEVGALCVGSLSD